MIVCWTTCTLIAGVCAWCFFFWFVGFFRASAQRRTPVRNQMHVCCSFSGDCGQHCSGCSSAVSPFPSAVPDRFLDVETLQDAVWSTAPTPTLLLLRLARDHTVLVPEDRCTLIAVAEGPPKQTAPVGICSQLRGVHSSLKRWEVGSHLTTCACSDRSSTQRLNIWRLKSRMCSTAIRCTRKQVSNTDKNIQAKSGQHRSETRTKLSKTRTVCGVWRKRR